MAFKEGTFPIIIDDIKPAEDMKGPIQDGIGGHKPGQLVKIRSCREEHGDKTYVGIYLGDITTGAQLSFVNMRKDEVTGMKRCGIVLDAGNYNPAIFVPELKTVIMGYESWWGAIESEYELNEITNDDIANVWYVKLLKESLKEKAGG